MKTTGRPDYGQAALCCFSTPALSALLAVLTVIALLQALGRACFHLDPEQRPTFRQATQQLQIMLADCQAAAPRPDAELPAHTRQHVDGVAVPDVVTCASQAVQHTELDLPISPAGATAAASG